MNSSIQTTEDPDSEWTHFFEYNYVEKNMAVTLSHQSCKEGSLRFPWNYTLEANQPALLEG